MKNNVGARYFDTIVRAPPIDVWCTFGARHERAPNFSALIIDNNVYNVYIMYKLYNVM